MYLIYRDFFGRSGRILTCDPLVPNEVLYASESRHRGWRNTQIVRVVSIGGPGGLA
jgi:hypothetical protein